MSDQALRGHRGYIGSRAYTFGEFPQFVQNMVIRQCCQRHHLTYLLSATEYRMSGCYMMLQELVSTSDNMDGIVMFSVFMLPEQYEARVSIYNQLLQHGKTLYFALEDLSITTGEQVKSVEALLHLNQIVVSDAEMHALLPLVQAEAVAV